MARYERECRMLAYLSKRQLNLSKNKLKPNFEEQPLEVVFDKLMEEIEELRAEVEKEDINFNLLRFELGDVAGCLVGLIAKSNQMEKLNGKTI